MPNAGRLREALRDLELLVCVDVFVSRTASLAHVPPATTPLQRPDLPFVFPLLLGMQARPYLRATDAVVPPDDEQRDGRRSTSTSRACGVGLFGSVAARRAVEARCVACTGLGAAERGEGVPRSGSLTGLLRLGGKGASRTLLRERHGWLRPDHAGGDFLGSAASPTTAACNSHRRC